MKKKTINYIVENARDGLWGLTVSTVGFECIPPKTPYPTREHPQLYYFNPKQGRVLSEYQLVYILEGKGELTTQSIKKTLVPSGSIFLLFPGEWHTYKPDYKTGWHQYWIGFKGPNMDRRIQYDFFRKENPLFNVGVHEELVSLFLKAINTAQEEKVGFQQILAGITNYLLGLTYSLDRDASFEDKEAVNQIKRARVLMREQMDSVLYVPRIAREVGMSDSLFRKLFREYVGQSPYQYFQQIKIQRAKELICTTTLSIKEIAFTLGFEDPDYFSSQFKKKTGKKPGDFRN